MSPNMQGFLLALLVVAFGILFSIYTKVMVCLIIAGMIALWFWVMMTQL